MVDGPLSLTLLFRFNDAGLIGSFRAKARGGMIDGGWPSSMGSEAQPA